MHLSTNARGDLRVCCNSTSGKNTICNPNGIPYRLDDEDILQFWNSSTLTTLRQEFIDGKKT